MDSEFKCLREHTCMETGKTLRMAESQHGYRVRENRKFAFSSHYSSGFAKSWANQK